MCGLIATIGVVPRALYVEGVTAAARRGPHSWGWAEHEGDWKVERGKGRLSPRKDPSLLAVGHSRLATSSSTPGDTPPAAEGQPLLRDGWVFAHNGASSSNLCDGYPAPSDSHAIFAAILTHGMNPDFARTFRDLLGGAPHAMILAHPDRGLTAIRVDGDNVPAHPLYLQDATPGGIISSGRPSKHAILLPVGATHLAPR